MAHLDDELAQALKDSEEQAATQPLVAPVVLPPGDLGKRPPTRGNLGLLVGLLVAAGGILALVLNNADDSAIYSKDVDQLLAQAPKLKDRNVNVKGMLVKGTLQSNLAYVPKQPCEYRFVLYAKDGQKLPVRYGGCVIPDTFRDLPTMDVEVTATGKLTAEGYFQAENIMAKCPSKYEMKQRALAGEAAPHQGVKGVGPGSNSLPPLGTPLDNVEDQKIMPRVVSGSGKEG